MSNPAGDFLIGVTIIILGLSTAIVAAYIFSDQNILLDEVKSIYDLHKNDIEINKLASATFPQMLENIAPKTAFELGKNGGVGEFYPGSKPYVWYDDISSNGLSLPLYSAYIHSKTNHDLTINIPGYASMSEIKIGIEAIMLNPGTATVRISGMDHILTKSGLVLFSQSPPASGQLNIHIENGNVFLIEGIFVSYDEKIIQSVEGDFQRKIQDGLSKLKEVEKDNYLLEGNLVSFFSPDKSKGAVSMLFENGLYLKTLPPTIVSESETVVKSDRYYEANTYSPYWALYDKASSEASSAAAKKTDLESFTNSLPDKITHTDYYCEALSAADAPNPSRKTSSLHFSCEQLLERYLSGASMAHIGGQISSHISSWSDASARKKYEASSVLPTSISVPKAAASYASIPETNDQAACGCKIWNTECTGTNSHACPATPASPSPAEINNCNSDSLCQWNTAEKKCKPKACNSWNANENVCKSASCTWNPEASCQTAYKKFGQTATCEYEYIFDATAKITIESNEKVFVQSKYQDLNFVFLEKFHVADANIHNAPALSYVTNVDSSPSSGGDSSPPPSSGDETPPADSGDSGTPPDGGSEVPEDEEPETPTPTPCNPSWTCTSWSSCTGSLQTRTCTDNNSCGTNNGKPPESQSCSSGGCNSDADCHASNPNTYCDLSTHDCVPI